jgi:hypothetical protein
MQTGCPLKILYVHSVYVDDPLIVEKELHQYFANFNHFLEWFKLNTGQVKECCTLMNLQHDQVLYEQFANPTQDQQEDDEELTRESFDDETEEPQDTMAIAASLERLLFLPSEPRMLGDQQMVQEIEEPSIDDLPDDLKAICAYAKKYGTWVTARECMASVRCLRGVTTEAIRDKFCALAELGVGSVRGSEQTIKYRYLLPTKDINLNDIDSLPSELRAIAAYAMKEGGWIKARDCQRNITGFGGYSASQVRKWFQQLADLDCGFVDGDKTGLTYRLVVESKKVRQSLPKEWQAIVNYADRQGDWLKPHQFRSSVRMARDYSADQIRVWLSELSRLGFGTVRGEGIYMEYRSNQSH